MDNIKIIGYAAAIVSVILTGAIGIFVRNISLDGSIITFARLGLGLVFLFFFLIFKKDLKTVRINKISFPLFFTGVLMAMVSYCYINAINSTSLANAAFLLYLAPLIAVGIAAVLLKEKFSILNGGLLCIAFIGFLFFLEFKLSLNMEESRYKRKAISGPCSSPKAFICILFISRLSDSFDVRIFKTAPLLIKDRPSVFLLRFKMRICVFHLFIQLPF